MILNEVSLQFYRNESATVTPGDKRSQQILKNDGVPTMVYLRWRPYDSSKGVVNPGQNRNYIFDSANI
ncbi:Hypothetical predicted protein [Octopus vulgaris]|uniref:Uncharacterized protein n=1 Tax=Octopus vulgaris TaxID=6645 RepID=A0AA36BMM9_OCTVU|nr:Hypothetical predicted protein [Octopus vulgaris]